MDDLDRLEAELLKDPEFKAEYDALEPEYELIRQIISARTEKKMTQKQLAEKIGTKQSNIARLESGNYNPSFQFLQKVAGMTLSQIKKDSRATCKSHRNKIFFTLSKLLYKIQFTQYHLHYSTSVSYNTGFSTNSRQQLRCLSMFRMKIWISNYCFN